MCLEAKAKTRHLLCEELKKAKESYAYLEEKTWKDKQEITGEEYKSLEVEAAKLFRCANQLWVPVEDAQEMIEDREQ